MARERNNETEKGHVGYRQRDMGVKPLVTYLGSLI